MLILFKIFLTNLYFYLYGKTFSNYYFKKNSNKLSENAIFGTILVSFIALLTNFFPPLNKVISTIIFIIPFLFFLKIKISKKELFFCFKTSIIVFLLIAYSDINRPDAGLYHLPYTQVLNENKIIVGLSNLHFRFGHISIIQYISAINNNYITGIQSITIPLGSLVVFIIFYFVDEVISFLKNTKFELNDIFSLFVLIYIAYKINRYSAFGNDAPAHLLFFYLISIYLKSEVNYNFLKKTSLTATYIFLNKITLGLAFFIPFTIYLKLNKKYKIFFSFSSLLIILWLLKNILVSGCLIYPINKTCFYKFSWADKTETIKQNISAEVWSKGWPDRNDEAITENKFLKNFNWVNTWSSNHLRYILKILIPYIFLLLVILFVFNFYKKNKNKYLFVKDNKKKNVVITISTLGSIIFFLKFPLYRYGYSYLVTLIIFLIGSYIHSYNLLLIKKIFRLILIASIIVFFAKQLDRINNNYKSYNIWPSIYSFIPNKESIEPKEKIVGTNYKIFVSEKECMYLRAPCTNIYKLNIKHKKIIGYDLIYTN